MNILGIKLNNAIFVAMALLVPVASITFLSLASMGKLQMLSEKDLVRYWQSQDALSVRPLYYLNYLPVSARFYSQGHVIQIDSGFSDLLKHDFWLAVHKTEGDASAWNCSLKFQPKRGIFDLHLCEHPGD